ncbi:hypothetical protein FH972_021265 [Carpinus fangiana]|uniref:Amino acid transporter transmembrane domain-containing protein n=1 Tax=Carpinus fangiana TaxID=176857 RepID=A0A5N6KNX3_9ROSI|nr:hypothetical protein FH972_021265 [Carpinus fangiana]
MTSPNSRPLNIQRRPSQETRGRSPVDNSHSRVVSNARLASPVPASALDPAVVRNSRSPDPAASSGRQSPLPGSSGAYASGPGSSALADALNAAGSLRARSGSPAQVPTYSPQLGLAQDRGRTDYGSFAPSSMRSGLNGSPRPLEDFDVIRRHLAGPEGTSPRPADLVGQSSQLDAPDPHRREDSVAPAIDDDEFSSLRMQGGDITREIYRRTEAEATIRRGRAQRSQSIPALKSGGDDEDEDYASINQPGGFRREHIRRQVASPGPSVAGRRPELPQAQPSFLTRNFYEFLSLYGHFAGEDVDEDDSQGDTDSEWAHGEQSRDFPGVDDEEGGEQRPLLKRNNTQRRSKKEAGPKKGAAGTVFILLKSFVGTGVLFLPRAFLNGGMLFSLITLLAVSLLSYYCFLLLTTSRLKLKGSFAQMGEMTYGPVMRFLINTSLVVSQMGFASAYIVFTSENLQAFILAVSKCKTFIDIRLMILMQLIIFLPLSLYRNLNNISYIVYIADIFIVLGLVYLYYFDIATLVGRGGVADIAMFNSKSWPLFIGTAIFTFEGIGLIIPIQDGMKKPAQLPAVLGGVMIIITVIFVSMGALAYAAFGSKTETVVLLNMPQDNKFVNGVQFIYSLAILLSTPMQIFPAITIMEKGIFSRSGKYSKGIKWRKNAFRFSVVMLAAGIAWVGANDLDKFVALVGSFACIPLVYIYPTMIHQKGVAEKRWQRVVDWALCAFGFILMAYTTVLTVVSWIGGQEEPKHGYCDH